MRTKTLDRVAVPEYLDLPPLQHMLQLDDATLKGLKMLDKKVGVTFGAFDLLHAGHMAMFREVKARRVCDFLFVGIQSDPTIDRPEKNPPSETLQERHWRVDTNKYVDGYAMYHTEAELEEFLRRYSRKNGGFIDVRILDEEYRHKQYTGKGLIEPYYNWRDHPWSTSTLKKRVHADEERKLQLVA